MAIIVNHYGNMEHVRPSCEPSTTINHHEALSTAIDHCLTLLYHRLIHVQGSLTRILPLERQPTLGMAGDCRWLTFPVRGIHQRPTGEPTGDQSHLSWPTLGSYQAIKKDANWPWTIIVNNDWLWLPRSIDVVKHSWAVVSHTEQLLITVT